MFYWKKTMLTRTKHDAFISKVLILLNGVILSVNLTAQTTSPVVQTQDKLKQLDHKIHTLQKNLVSAHDKRGLLNKELEGTEQQISNAIQQLRTIQQDIHFKEHKIAALQKMDNNLNTQLSNQQKSLAKHIRARYQMGEYQPIKWIINQEDPHKMGRILTYYQYVIKSRQQLIDTIDETRKKILENKKQLRNELTKKQGLKNQLTQHQKKLQQNKRYHTTLIHSLNNQILSNQHVLNDFQKDKDNLSHILKSLEKQSVVKSSIPFVQMRRKLPFPVQTNPNSLKKMNQGVTFFADEGAVVTAVYPGKVVFSDWLKGYGLLLIIDHGQGFMTLYAHNQALFKHKGQTVEQREQVATVGHSGGIKQNGLYFEIRARGKAVSPLDWLS